MCQRHSESGARIGHDPCAEYKKLEESSALMTSLHKGAVEDISALTVELDRLRQERDALLLVMERADALADAVEHAEDLTAAANYLRERMEELRQSVSQPWKMQIDDYSAAVKEALPIGESRT